MHPKSGLQLYESVMQTKDDEKHQIKEIEIRPSTFNEILSNFFPHHELTHNVIDEELTQLYSHLENFTKKMDSETFPSKTKPYPLNYSLDDQSGILMYTLCRLIKPELVVETGVAYGISTSFILKALHDNKKGKLFSIDYVFRPWESKNMIGIAIPDELRNNWELVYGPSASKLPKLLKSLGKIDIFFHDSLHTFKNMIFEYNTAWPHIKKNGFLLSDDVLSNNAFNDFYMKNKLTPKILQQKNTVKSYLGILQK
ncbi:MAG: class I SAM-dependent methyltransferase [Crenarchaeota archaeon]|nr:MAG: class I SAM-dependent methyltransferase [Thermoproteota archaeon]